MSHESNERPANIVVVPSTPGPLVRLTDLERGDDDIDVVLDVFFGEADDSGPSTTDVVLMGGGAAAVVAGQTTSLPLAVTVVGAGAFGLGAILPFQSMGRKIATQRHRSKLDAMVGTGTVMRTDAPAMAKIVAKYDRLAEVSHKARTTVPPAVLNVAHTLIYEVATLLNGHLPTDREEAEYVTDRVTALDDLASAVSKNSVGKKEAARRRALLAARREVDETDGQSSLVQAATLAAELLDTDG